MFQRVLRASLFFVFLGLWRPPRSEDFRTFSGFQCRLPRSDPKAVCELNPEEPSRLLQAVDGSRCSTAAFRDVQGWVHADFGLRVVGLQVFVGVQGPGLRVCRGL